MSKKVILIIVEGQTEELILFDFLQERFSNAEVRIDIQCGDIVGNWNRKFGTSKVAIEDVVANYLELYRLIPSDLLAIIQFTDTDGCFIENKYIRVDRELARKMRYSPKAIYVSNQEKKLQMIQRNTDKAKSTIKLANNRTMKAINLQIPYCLGYFSINLDHVLWDEQNTTGRSKLDKAEQFLEQLAEPLDQFMMQFILVDPHLPLEEKLEKSWIEIRKELNSLQRSTNMPFVLEFVDSLA